MLRNRNRLLTMFIFLLIFGIFIELCDSTFTSENDAYESPGEDGYAFFALRSCHGVLQGDSGEFFSPDYLCSNPPLWCKWTIQVHPGKHVQLYLKDFTPPDACHLKLDQIQLAEPSGVSGGNKVLEKCWQEAKYTSLSNTLHVVLLIRGSPIPPFRGFYGRYQAFEPPIVYKPHGDDTEGNGKWMKEDVKHETVKPTIFLRDFTTYVPTKEGEPTQPILLESSTPAVQGNYNEMEEYFDLLTSVSNELPLEEDEPVTQQKHSRSSSVQVEADEWSAARTEETVVEKVPLEHNLTWQGMVNHIGDISPPSPLTPAFTSTPTIAIVPTLGTSRLGRSASQTPIQLSNELEVHSPSLNMYSKGVQATVSVINPHTFLHIQSDVRRSVDARSLHVPPATEEHTSYTADVVSVEGSHHVSPPGADQGEDPVMETSWSMNAAEQLPTISSPMPDDEQGHAQNHTEVPHLPGDHLFEVSVELTFSLEDDSEEHWDHLSSTLLMSTKELIHEQLKILIQSITISSKRIKRLSAGVLYILWLQMADGTEGMKFRSTLHAALQELVSTNISLHGSFEQAMIISLSTADVNECATQLVLCDINAECLNHFGSYACRCRPGFEDASRLGSGGTLCVDLKAAGTEQHHSQEDFMKHQRNPILQPSNSSCVLATSSGMVQGIYVVSFLLSFLLLMLMTVMGVLYHRHHRGTFLVRCRSSSFGSAERNGNNNNDDEGSVSNSDVPPPPPPIRRPKEGWSHPKDCCTTVDLPLLRFSPLHPLDGYMEPGEGTTRGS
ncbi:uncharacterized protein zgc:66455 isoform X3 [Osmerus eperlanus]|uniref:uncharacterized protein zgc:66455 isoform X3 n=1 Tax=Osmerus eperlanus TaxID=29151 RepID=UPI002E0F02C0